MDVSFGLLCVAGLFLSVFLQTEAQDTPCTPVVLNFSDTTRFRVTVHNPSATTVITDVTNVALEEGGTLRIHSDVDFYISSIDSVDFVRARVVATLEDEIGNNLFRSSILPGDSAIAVNTTGVRTLRFVARRNPTTITSLQVSGCTCSPGFRGEWCQIVDHCYMNTMCVNGACVQTGDTASCSCFLGFIGHFCDVEVDECASGPCGSFGTCQDLFDDYSCTCTDPRYTGRHCDEEVPAAFATYDCGLDNPCTAEVPTVPGLYFYGSHTSGMYVECTTLGLCYENDCPPSSVWNQYQQACSPVVVEWAPV